MPITPLHLGILAPINHWLPGRVSNVSFILMTLLIDSDAILYFVFGVNSTGLHSPATHSFVGVSIIIAIIAACGFWSKRWVYGVVLGGYTHILVDMLVHSEMLPLYPYNDNPFFIGAMDWISLLLIAPLVWLIVQYVSAAVGRIQRGREPSL